MVIFVITFTFLVGLAALAIEGGRAEADRRFLQAITDGAALAGAEYLDADTTATDYQPAFARQTAAKYVYNGLAGGTQAGNGPACSFSSDITPGTCDPDLTHKLTVVTPYNGNPDQILIRVDNNTAEILGTVVGITNATTAARAVAHKVAGGKTFPYALYVGGNLTSNGDVNLQVGGNTYIQGCIQVTNASTIVGFADNGEAGSIDVLADPKITAAIGGSAGTPQNWVNGGSSGCKAPVFSRDSFGQAGSSVVGSATTCGKTAAPTQFFLTCPTANVPTVTAPTGYKHVDPCAPTSTPAPPPSTWVNGSGPGCYNACTANTVSGHFSPGIYGFIGAACGPGKVNDLIFSTNSDGAGVSFVLTNGAGVCLQSCSSSGTANLTFSPPGPGLDNEGLLFYVCSGGSLGCSSGGGPVTFKGPSAAIDFASPSLIFAPSSLCTLQANGAQQTFGQIICKDLSLQGGASSSAEQVFFGGPGLPLPLFEVSLIE